MGVTGGVNLMGDLHVFPCRVFSHAGIELAQELVGVTQLIQLGHPEKRNACKTISKTKDENIYERYYCDLLLYLPVSSKNWN